MFEQYFHDDYASSQKHVTPQQWSYFFNNLSTVDLDSLTTGVLEFHTDYAKETSYGN